MKLTISPTPAWPRRCSTVPTTTTTMTAMVLAARVITLATAHQFQHRELVAQHFTHDVAETQQLLAQPAEGLHDGDVGQRVLRGADQFHLPALRPGADRPRCG